MADSSECDSMNWGPDGTFYKACRTAYIMGRAGRGHRLNRLHCLFATEAVPYLHTTPTTSVVSCPVECSGIRVHKSHEVRAVLVSSLSLHALNVCRQAINARSLLVA